MRALSPLETVTVILILLVFLVLGGPAILQQREQARNSQKVANLQRLGLSLNAYHDTFLAFPAGSSTPPKPATQSPDLPGELISPF